MRGLLSLDKTYLREIHTSCFMSDVLASATEQNRNIATNICMYTSRSRLTQSVQRGLTSAGVGGGAGGSDPARVGIRDDSACDGAGVMGAPGARSRSPLGAAPASWLLGAGVMGRPGARSPRRAASRRSISGVVAAGEDARGMPGARSRWSLSSNSVLGPGDAG